MPRAELTSVNVLVSSDLNSWTEMGDVVVVDNGIGRERVVTVVKPESPSAFFWMTFEYMLRNNPQVNLVHNERRFYRPLLFYLSRTLPSSIFIVS